MSLAAFKRRIKVGQHVTVVNYMHPKLSEERTVHQVQSRELKTMAEGAHVPWTVPWPAKDEWRIEGDTLHWVDPKNPDNVLVSYTFRFDAAVQHEPETTAGSNSGEAPETTADSGSGREPENVLTSYRVTWAQKGNDKSHTETCIIDSDDMTRPGDPEQRNGLLRRMLAIRHLPTGGVVPDNIVLQGVVPLCNCEPYPGQDCAFAHHGGDRFYLTASSQPGYEVIRDLHREQVLGNVCHTLSVEFLTLVREKYGHQ